MFSDNKINTANPSASFVGGAEMARRNARKRLRQPARAYHVSSSGNYYGKRGNWNNIPTIIPFPKSMRPSERFFGSILSSSVTSFQESETAEKGAHQKIMHHACSLLDVPALPVKPRMAAPQLGDDSRTHHLTQRSCSFLGKVASYSSTSSGTFENARSYYLSKAPLILEESRCIIAEALLKSPLHNRQRSRAKSSNSSSFGTTFPLELLSVDEKYPNKVMHRGCSPIVLNFQIVNGFGKNSSSFHARQQQRRNFHVGDLKWTRPGSVVVLRQCQEQISTDKSNNDSPDNLPFTVLACVQPQPRMKDTGEEGFSSNSFLSLMLFRKDDLNIDAFLQNSTHDMDIKCSTKFEAIPLTTLISQVRQMEACLRLIKVPFLPKLLGRKDATHIRFDDSSSDEEEIIVDDMDPDVGDDGPNGEGLSEDEEGSTSIATEIGDDDDGDYDGGNASISRLLSSLPTLNKTQERAAQKFLNSPPSSLILVQGPPGTGKTTFLVNTIFRRLASDSTARILVTAPTNKAVTVLAQRFLDVINNSNGRTCHYYNAVLVGVEDKLISDSSSKDDAEFLSADSLPSSLRSIFVYTWVETIKNECTSIFKSLQILHAVKQQKAQTSDSTIDALVERSSKIESQLFKSIPSVYSSCKHAKLLAQKIKATVAAELWESSLANILSDDMHCNSSFSLLDGAIHHAESLIESLDEIDSYTIIGELLATARVIFCTLSTAGASIVKQTHQIDDLLVDEAAAATEPEIWIPFHLHPKRMLAVGDPDQLPPTIVSRFAADMGLSKSMHERLMHECGEEYFMLDHQYRMNPLISSFPCKQFYDGKILDGKNVTSKSYSSDIALKIFGNYSFIDIAGTEFQESGGSYANKMEAEAIVGLIEMISKDSSVSNWDSPDKIRIITFYQGQVNLLKRDLAGKGFHGVLVATVDSSQGCEADVVIISFVRSNSKKGVRHAAGFLCDNRRINVALTRPRHQLICVGNATGTLGSEGSEALKNLVTDAKQRKCLV